MYFSIGTHGQPREPALCQLYRHTFVPCWRANCRTAGSGGQYLQLHHMQSRSRSARRATLYSQNSRAILNTTFWYYNRRWQ